MKIGIISDIHGNIAALEAVINDMNKNNIDKIYCLGDLVGYLTHPDEVIQKIKELSIVTLLGNHDEKYLKTQNPINITGTFMKSNISEESRFFFRDFR